MVSSSSSAAQVQRATLFVSNLGGNTERQEWGPVGVSRPPEGKLMTLHVLVLGAGFGGLELATRLSELLADQVRVTLIDRNDSFFFGFSKLDVLFGKRTPDDCACRMRR